MLLVPNPALAWGSSGHRIISEIAIENLPDEIPAFLRSPEIARQIGELGREPDRSKGTGNPHDADLNPGHYVNIGDDKTVFGVPLNPLPLTREDYDTALRSHGTDEFKAGYLPYSIIDGWQQLEKDFAYWRADSAGERIAKSDADREFFGQDRALRETLTIRDLGYWSHFVGDASQPMHVSVHYNGWGDYPNPNNYTSKKIHAYFEGEFVRRYVTKTDAGAKIPAYRDCRCSIQDRTIAYLLASQAQLVPLFELEKTHAFDGVHSEGKDFAAERLAAASGEIRDMVVDAWRASADATVGYPPVSVRNVESGKSYPIEELKGLD